MIHDVSDTNQLMKKIFPNSDNYIMNSMTPSLSYNEGQVIVSMLVLGDDFMLQDFKADKDGNVKINTTCYIERNEHNIGKNLVIRFDFLYKTGHPMFESIIVGDQPEAQKAFINALNKVDKIYIWVADNTRKVFKIMEINWDYDAHKEVLDRFDKTEQEVKKCPMCSKQYFGLGALSRKDNKTEICSDCGIEEALTDM